MANIYVDYEGAMAIVSSISSLAEQLQETATRITGKVDGELPDTWQGASASKAIETFDAEYKNFLTVEVPERVNSLKAYIQGCVESIKETDASLAG